MLLDPHGMMPLLQAGERKAMRQSTIGNVEVCSYREKMRRDHPIGYSSSDARCLGTGYHAGLETYWEGRKNGVVVTPDEIVAAIQLSIEDDVRKSEDRFVWVKFHNVEDMVNKAVEMVGLYLGHHVHRWDGYHVLGTEISFAMPYGDEFVAIGTMDLVLADDLGRYIIVDHKTANRMWSYKKHLTSPQPGWYSYWWGEAGKAMGMENMPIARMCFEIMTYAGKFDRRWVIPTHRLQMATLEKADVACQLELNDGPWWPNTSSNLCSEKYCDHFEACPHGGQLVSIQMEAARLHAEEEGNE